MKIYINIIIVAAMLLILFPFLGLPELWENLYVILLAFVIGVSVTILRHKSGLVKDLDDEGSLQEYIADLRKRFDDSQNDSHTTKSL